MKKDNGFIGLLLLIIIALALLRYFLNWSIFDAAHSDQGVSTINYIKEVIGVMWSYLKIPTLYIWETVLTYLPPR
jgi:hypothetical protein